MNATERARRSDSLYYDTQVTNRRALCDMIANRESALAESKAENAKLRHDLEEANNQAEEVCIENAKLRELVAEIYEDQCDNSERWRYRDRMRELGIEEDE